MKIWILKERTDLDRDNPWTRRYDIMIGAVVVAEDQECARELASHRAKDEGSEVWLDSRFTTCEEVDLTKESVIITDEQNG